MTGRKRALTRRWLLLALAVVLISSHALILRDALEHKTLAASVLAGVMFLMLLTHLGLLGRLYELLRRRSRS